MTPPDVARRQTPEDRELEKKKAELTVLEAELAQRELDLATLGNELHAFEARYLRTVGALYAELDELEAQLAEARARQHPHDHKVHEQAAARRAKATASAHVIEDVHETKRDAFAPGDDLKKLYREVARNVHPDLSTNEVDRHRRTRLMAEANRAYAEGNETRLRAILDEWQSSPESVEGEGIGPELVRTIRKIHQVEQRLSQIAAEIEKLTRSEVYELKQRADSAHKEGSDLLAEMASQLNEELGPLRVRVQTETAR